MGYYTRYALETMPESALPEVMEAATDDMRYALGDDGLSGDSCKWYDHEDEMSDFSKKFPDVTFKLHGEGEENDDIWDKYFRNGKKQICRAQIVIPPMDEKAFE